MLSMMLLSAMPHVTSLLTWPSFGLSVAIGGPVLWMVNRAVKDNAARAPRP